MIDSPGILFVFDVDETLFHTTARTHVYTDEGRSYSLTSAELNSHTLAEGEYYDFNEFESAFLFIDTSTPIKSVWKDALLCNRRARENPDSRVVVITARPVLDDMEMFQNHFFKYGLDVKVEDIYCVGGSLDAMSSAEAKKDVVQHILEWGNYGEVVVYEDSEKNLRKIMELQKECLVRVSPILVTDGKMRQIH